MTGIWKFMGLAVLAGLGAAPVSAQGLMCGQRDVVISELATRYGEEVHGMGLANQNRIVEVHVSQETGTWTITVTSVNGTTCLVASGQHFAVIAPPVPGEDL